MTTNHNPEHLVDLVNVLRKLPTETEWIEFKQNDAEPEKIGERLSALANSAALCGKACAYQAWRTENETHAVVGTSFSPDQVKVGNEEPNNRLLRQLSLNRFAAGLGCAIRGKAKLRHCICLYPSCVPRGYDSK